MKVEFDVKMTTPVMYDYMMYHTVTGVQFWLVIAIGLMLICTFFNSHNPLHLIFAIAVLVYLPIERYIQAKKQVALNPVFKKVLHYTLDDEKMAIDVPDIDDEQAESEEVPGKNHMEAKWDSVVKVRNTKKSLILYTNRVTATIFPREALGADYEKAVELIKNGVPAERVRIR